MLLLKSLLIAVLFAVRKFAWAHFMRNGTLLSWFHCDAFVHSTSWVSSFIQNCCWNLSKTSERKLLLSKLRPRNSVQTENITVFVNYCLHNCFRNAQRLLILIHLIDEIHLRLDSSRKFSMRFVQNETIFLRSQMSVSTLSVQQAERFREYRGM